MRLPAGARGAGERRSVSSVLERRPISKNTAENLT